MPLVAPLKSEQLLVRNAVGGIPVHIEQVVNKLVLETVTANQEGLNNRLSAALETLVVRIVHKVVNASEFVSRFSDAVINSPGCIAPVVALVKMEHRKLVTEQGKIEDRFWQFVEARLKFDRRPVSVPSEGSDRPLTDIPTIK